jgi:radical SAM superfamily enzyme YgiQ (UPF0313 family)
MPDILLTALNAKFPHAAFGLRYLMANLGSLAARAEIAEFDINRRPLEMVEEILARRPRIVGLGVYIWNVTLAGEVAALLKRLEPGLILILGGPEISFETGAQAIAQLADYVITGEADLKFAEVCRHILDGVPPARGIIPSPIPDLSQVALPYEWYGEDDLRHRITYVETSRGCPFGCEFCLSALEVPVRTFPPAEVLASLERLLQRGARHFKFVDRTFNVNLRLARAVLEFFLARQRPGLFLHFELVPDRLPESLRDLLRQFPAGMVQLEIGVQTLNPEVAERINRRQDYQRIIGNFHFLRQHTQAHLHADLVAGLPGETMASFAAGFDQLLALAPQEIQVGILKRLRGAPIARHDAEWGMVYSPLPPYELLRNRTLTFEEMTRLRRFARAWDLVANSGNFPSATPLLWHQQTSAFAGFLEWSDWLFAREGRGHSIALFRLCELLFRFLTTVRQLEPGATAQSLLRDYQKTGRSDLPPFLKPFIPENCPSPSRAAISGGAKRQIRHAAPD